MALAVGVISACTSLFSLGAMRSTVFGSKFDLPAGRGGTGQLDLFRRRRARVGERRPGSRFPCRPKRARSAGLRGRLMSILGWPVMSRTSSVVAVASSADTFAATLYLPAATVFGGRTLSLTSLDWPGSSGSALSSWLPYCSVKVASKFCGAGRRQAHHDLLAAVVLDAELELEGRLRRAAQLRQLRIERELGRQVGRERHCDRQARHWCPALAR